MSPAALVRSSLVAPLLLGAAAGPLVSYPDKPIVYICQASAGGSSDRFVRHVVKLLRSGGHLPVPITVEYRAGGGGAIAANYLRARVGNPYYLLNASGNFVAAPLRDPSVPGYPAFTPIARLAFDLNGVVVRKDGPFQTLTELVAAAKANPRGLSWAGTSVGSQDHLTVLLLEKATGAKFNFVSFGGSGEVLAALLGGHVDIAAMEPVVAQPNVAAGRVRILGVVSEKRLGTLPDVPTLQEQGFDVVLNMQRGVVAAGEIPPDARKTLVEAFQRMSGTAEWKEYLAMEGLLDAFLAGDGYARFLAEESARWEQLLREAGVIQGMGARRPPSPGHVARRR
jgi:putative tricarboxylic transport membrane protein